MARPAKHNRQASQREASASNDVNGTSNAGEPIAADATRAMLNASLNASLNLLRFIEELHQMQTQQIQNIDEALTTAASEASQGAGLQDLLNSQLTLAAEQFERNAKLSTQLFTRLVEAETQWVEQAQSNAANLAQGWLAAASPEGTAAAETQGVERAVAPLAMIGTAQTALAQITKLWVDAVSQRPSPQQ